MTKSINVLEKKLGGNIGGVLVMLLVAGSSFLLGLSVNNKSDVQTASIEPTAQTQSVIGDISNALQNITPPNQSTSETTNDTVASPVISGIININSGSQVELESLPGIGPAKAKAIIDYRNQNGPFIRIEDIEKVKGIGPKTFQGLKSKITV